MGACLLTLVESLAAFRFYFLLWKIDLSIMFVVVESHVAFRSFFL